MCQNVAAPTSGGGSNGQQTNQIGCRPGLTFVAPKLIGGLKQMMKVSERFVWLPSRTAGALPPRKNSVPITRSATS